MKQPSRPLPALAAVVLLAGLVPALQGCFPVVAAGAGAGALMISDRRYAETYLADEAIEIRAANRAGEKFGDKIHLNVTSYNRMVLLTGEVPDATTRAEVERTVGSVPNVKAVTNELQVAGISSFGARGNDTYISSKVKARFIDANKFAANHVKVVTEAGVVYLLGIVTQKEADAAVEVARTTGGVQKVVKVLEVISDEEARRLDARPAENAAGKQSQP